jgi:predicted  nucleic acid-binding Zn-ribbon protein
MPDNQEKTVPYSRFAAVNKAKAELQAQVEALTPIKEAYEKLQGDFTTLQTEYGQYKEQTTIQQALVTEGITDPEVQEFLQYKWGKAPDSKESPRPDFQTWLGQYKESSPTILSQAKPVEAQPARDPMAEALSRIATAQPVFPPAPAPKTFKPTTMTAQDLAKLSPAEFAQLAPTILGIKP